MLWMFLVVSWSFKISSWTYSTCLDFSLKKKKLLNICRLPKRDKQLSVFPSHRLTFNQLCQFSVNILTIVCDDLCVFNIFNILSYIFLLKELKCIFVFQFLLLLLIIHLMCQTVFILFVSRVWSLPLFIYASLVFTHCLVLWISGWFMDSVLFPAPYLHFCAWPTSALFRNTWILDLAPCLIPACETALALFNSAPPTCACGDLSGFVSWMTANLVEPFLWKKII